MKRLPPSITRKPFRGTGLRRLVSSAALLVLVAQLSGCLSLSPDKAPSISQVPDKGDIPCGKPQSPSANLVTLDKPQKASDQKDPELDLWVRLRENFRLWDIDHPRVDAEIKRLQRSPHSFNVLISRAQPFLFHILSEVETRGLPGELALLPAIESGFRPYAYSQLGAAGLWQFMPATGRSLGLTNDHWYDSRRDVSASTDAALTYLERLNRRMDGNWLLALASYNAGAGNVRKALRKARENSRSTAFWELELPKETRDYIPRLLAMATVVSAPEQYGLSLPELANRPYFTDVKIPGQMDLQVAAGLAKMPIEDLLQLNPGFSRGVTGPQGPHRLLLPIAQAPLFNRNLAELPPSQYIRWRSHRVVKGDTLLGLAKRYKVSVASIKQTNNIRGNTIRAGKALRIPSSNALSLERFTAKLGSPKSRVRYRVRKGDSLYAIAQRFDVRIADLRRWNKLGKYLRPGQRLDVFINPIKQSRAF